MEEILNYIGENYKLNVGDNSNIFYIILANTKNEQLCDVFKWKVVPLGVKIGEGVNIPPENWKELIDISIKDINNRNPYLYLSNLSYRCEVVMSRFGWKFYNEKYYSFRGEYRPSEAGMKYIKGAIMCGEEQIVHSLIFRSLKQEYSFKIKDKAIYNILKIEDEYEFITYIKDLPEFLFKKLIEDRKTLAQHLY